MVAVQREIPKVGGGGDVAKGKREVHWHNTDVFMAPCSGENTIIKCLICLKREKEKEGQVINKRTADWGGVRLRERWRWGVL